MLLYYNSSQLVQLVLLPAMTNLSLSHKYFMFYNIYLIILL